VDPSALPPTLKVETAAEALRKEILRGAFGTDGQLPTEPELAKRFGAARETVRRALQFLKERGLVVSRQGTGTFVRPRPQRTVLWADPTVDRDNTGYTFHKTTNPWVALHASGPRRENVPADLVEDLGVGHDSEVVIWTALMGVPETDQPLQLATTYVPHHIAERLADLGTQDTVPDVSRLENSGPALSWSVEIGARMPERSEAAALKSPTGVPLVQFLRIGRQAGAVVEITECLLSSERFRIGYDLLPEACAESSL